MKNAPFVNFIGTDGSGKDTIFNKVVASFPNALLTREPGGTTEAEHIRRVILEIDLSFEERIEILRNVQSSEINNQTYSLLNHAIKALSLGHIQKAEPFLYAASRSESLEKSVRPALNQNKPVLGRRSVACSVAYQGNARGFGKDKIWNLNYPIVKDTLPSLEIFFELPVSVALDRLAGRTEKQDRLDGEGKEFFERVREGYLYYYKNLCPYPVEFVDATKPIEEVYEDVQQILQSHQALTAS